MQQSTASPRLRAWYSSATSMRHQLIRAGGIHPDNASHETTGPRLDIKVVVGKELALTDLFSAIDTDSLCTHSVERHEHTIIYLCHGFDNGVALFENG